MAALVAYIAFIGSRLAMSTAEFAIVRPYMATSDRLTPRNLAVNRRILTTKVTKEDQREDPSILPWWPFVFSAFRVFVIQVFLDWRGT